MVVLCISVLMTMPFLYATNGTYGLAAFAGALKPPH